MNEVCQWHKEIMLEVRCKMLDEGIPIPGPGYAIDMWPQHPIDMLTIPPIRHRHSAGYLLKQSMFLTFESKNCGLIKPIIP